MRELVVRRLAPLAVLSALVAAAGCATIGRVNIISEDQEMQMGAEFAAQLENELQFIRDPEIVGYVDSLGQAIAAVSERPNIPYRFHVVDTEDVNAFAVPGGYLYVNRGLIEAADNESELAGVISHEIGHIVGRHSARQMTQQIGIAGVASLLLGENPGQLQQMVAGLVANGTLMSYSRDMESEADRYGVDQMYRVGLDPMGLATFFDKLKAMSGGGERSGIETFFSTHPAPGDRAADVRAQLQQLPPKNLIEDRPRFQAVKQRVQGL